MIQKIISSGQPGVGRGAIDAAMALDIPYAGWTQTGPISKGEPLPAPGTSKETEKEEKIIYVEQNVNASDGTLIIAMGDFFGEPDLARKITKTFEKPLFLIDLGKTGRFYASQSLHEWLSSYDIHTLYVAGTTDNKNKKIQKATQNIIEATYYLGLIENNMTAPATLQPYQDDMETPTSLERAVSQTISRMKLKDRVMMANLSESELLGLQTTLGEYIQGMIPVWQESPGFIASLEEIENAALQGDTLVQSIIRRIWKALRETHKMRIVK